MANDSVSLSEYLAQSQRGLMGRIFGPDFLKKQTYLTVSASTFQQTYGRKIWDALNNRTVFYNALKKVPWGPTAGWVLRTDRGSGRMRPVTETGNLPTVDVSNYVGVYELPKIVAADFGVPVKSIVVNSLEGGMGDVLAAEMQGCERDFVKGVNQQLLAPTACLASGGSTTTVVVPSSIASRFSIGDTIAFYDISATGYEETKGGVISSISSGTITVSTFNTGVADGDVAYVKSRAGYTSIDDVVMEDDATAGGEKAASDVYNLTTRTAGAHAAGAYVSYNSGVGRDLTLSMIDTAIQKIRENGGEPKLIVTGWDQYFNLERLLNSQQRYMGQEKYQVGVGDERTLPGTQTGLILATYMGIPILPDADTAKSVDTSDNVLGSNLYVLDTDYLEMAVAMPTQYVENRDFFAANALVVRGLMYMMGELRCNRLDVQAKIADLNAS